MFYFITVDTQVKTALVFYSSSLTVTRKRCPHPAPNTRKKWVLKRYMLKDAIMYKLIFKIQLINSKQIIV